MCWKGHPLLPVCLCTPAQEGGSVEDGGVMLARLHTDWGGSGGTWAGQGRGAPSLPTYVHPCCPNHISTKSFPSGPMRVLPAFLPTPGTQHLAQQRLSSGKQLHRCPWALQRRCAHNRQQVAVLGPLSPDPSSPTGPCTLGRSRPGKAGAQGLGGPGSEHGVWLWAP